MSRPVRPAANPHCRAKNTSACRVADTPVCRKDHPRARFLSTRVLIGTGRLTSDGGLPAPAVGHSVEMLRHGLRISHFGPPCHGRPSSRTACPAVRTSGQLGRQLWKAFQHFPGNLLPPADVPGVYRLKARSVGTSGGDASCLRQGVPSGGLLAARQTPPAFWLKTKSLSSSEA